MYNRTVLVGTGDCRRLETSLERRQLITYSGPCLFLKDITQGLGYSILPDLRLVSY